MAGDVKLSVLIQAQDRATKVMRQAQRANDSLISSLKRAGGAQSSVSETVGEAIDAQGNWQSAIAASLRRMAQLSQSLGTLQNVLKIAAVGALAQGAKALFDFASAGAAAADQLDAVRNRVEGTDDLINRISEATAGIIPEQEIVKAIALFDSFGLELDVLPDLLEQAAKTSLRTGEGIDYLVDSAVRAVARLSPAIADNLGLQVSLASATERAAKKLGIEAKAVDATAQKAGMLSLIIEKLGTLNKDVDLNNSRVASLKRLEVTFGDTISSMRSGLASFVTGVSAASDATGRLAAGLSGQMVRSMRTARRQLNNTVQMLADTARQAINVDKALAKLGMASKARQIEEVELAKEMAKVRADSARAQADASKRLKANVEAGLDAFDEELRFRRAVQRIMNKAAADTKRAQETARLRAAAILKEERGRVEQLAASTKEIQAQINAINGISKAQTQLNASKAKELEIQAKIDAQQTEGSEQLQQALNFQKAYTLELTKQVAKERKKGGSIGRTKTVVRDLAAEANAAAAARLRDLDQELRILNEREPLAKAWVKFLVDIENIEKATAAVTDEALKSRLEASLVLRAEHDLSLAMLEAEKAKTEEIERQTAKIEERRQAIVDTLGAGLSDAFGEGADILRQVDSNLSDLGRPEKYQNIAAGLSALSVGVGPAIQAFSDLGKTSGAAGEQVASGVAAGLAVMGPTVAGFVGGVKEQAAIMGAFEAAMAVAMAFVDVPAAISHGIASAMFFAMAGVAAAQPTTPAPAAATSGPTGGGFRGGGGGDTGTVVVNIGEGMVFGRPSEIGRAVAERMATMDGTGMQATAF